MIQVLHGDDLSSSYSRLAQILAQYPNHKKVRFTEKSQVDLFVEELFAQDIFNIPKIIICENYITVGAVKEKILAEIPQNVPIIFWEHKQLTPAQITKIKNFTKIELFKVKSIIFYFLDSISPSATKSLKSLFKIKQEENLLWHLTNRFMLLTLIIQNFTKINIEAFLNKKIADWQWQKLKVQSKLFDKDTVNAIFSGLIKIDYLIKSGQTALSEINLINILFLKYLKS